jgi:hypothetical protein
MFLTDCHGFSHDEDAASINAARSLAAEKASGVPITFFEVDYSCTLSSGEITKEYFFYASTTDTMYMIQEGGVNGNDPVITVTPNDSPEDWCGGDVLWAFSSSQILAQFMGNDGGVGMLNDMTSEYHNASLDVSLGCMPSGLPEWNVSLSSTGSGNAVSKTQAYNALTGAVVR